MAGFPSPITKDNFSDAWRYVTRKYRWANKKAKMRTVALTLGQVLYLPGFLIMMLCAVCTLTPRSVTSFIEKAPFLVRFWNRLSGLLFAGMETTGQQLARCALILYGLPLAVFFAVSILILLLYHPKASKPSGSDRQDAEALWYMARHAKGLGTKKGPDVTGFPAILCGALAGAGTLGLIIYWVTDPVGKALFLQQGFSTTLTFFALALILIFSYNIIILPLLLVMKAFCACPMPKRLSTEAEIYCRSLRTRDGAIDEPAAALEETAASPEETAASPEETAEKKD